MRSRTSILRRLALSLVIVATGLPGLARGQVRIPSAALADVAELESIFRVGDQLERERRWGEALSHYEKARKDHPGRQEIEHRLTVARFHYEVVRRYSDTSFIETVRTIGEQGSLDLYGEVLLKIQAHHVQRADWNQLIERGLTAMEVAIAEPSFRRQHRFDIPEESAMSLLADIRQHFEAVPVYSRHDARQRVDEIADVLEQRLQLPSAVTVSEFTCAAAASLDDYSAFLTGNQLDDILSQIEGNFVGLGIELKAEDKALRIVSVIPGGPADQGGIVTGDRIVEVDGQSTRDISTDKAADMLKGIEGSLVNLVLLDPSGETRRLRLTRTRVDVPSVDTIQIVDKDYGIGYFRLSSFQKTTNRDVDAALWKLHQQGMRSLIVDVRGNPGGLLTAAVEVADKFVSQGDIVSTRGRSSGEDFDYKAHAVGTWRVPLIVLIDGDSASASEIFAGAIHDHRRGTLVGTRSYGKGSVQGIFPLSVANAGIRLTTAKFYSPSGQAISHRGVEPDVEVKATEQTLAAKPIDNLLPIVDQHRDAALTASLQIARQQLSQR
ncbi:MAG: S41 family peptidase [Planctomycetaceae bacterium]|nr:S41 family peptidase [Planctomycetales bacterium]MCB9936878.1 S41 family peptidase [Planctomycetaceae bacterium]